MKRLRKSTKMLRYNLRSVIGFEVLCKILFYAFMMPFFYSTINISIKLAGISYISKTTLSKYLKMPTTYLLMALLLILLAFCYLVHISGLIYAMDASNVKRKTSTLRMLINGIKNSLRLFKPENIWMTVYMLFLLPITCSSMVTATFMGESVPSYIYIFIKNHKKEFSMIATAAAVFSIIALIYVFSLNVFTLKKVKFKDALKESRKCMNMSGIRTIFGVLMINLISIIITIILSTAISTVVMQTISAFVKSGTINSIIDMSLKTISTVTYILFSIIIVPYTYAYICNSYYSAQRHGIIEENEHVDEDYNPAHRGMKERAAFAVIITVALALDISYFVLRQNNVVTIDAEYINHATVAAHRGASTDAPENTLPAFEKAIEANADVIELDVQETKDGVIVVMHDSTLTRTTGVNKKVGELTYEELLELDAGAYFSEEYKETRIPTLVEVIELVDGRCELNIELKPQRNTDDGFERKVCDIIKEYDLYRHCVLTSPNYNTIKNVKLIDPDIKTIYVMSVAVGEFYNLEYADGFSINYRYISSDLVKMVHKKGKTIYAWTIDDETKIESMLLMGVDSVVTNKPYEMKMIVEKYTDSMFERIMKKYFGFGI